MPTTTIKVHHPRLIRRVNQLYHELTQSSFEREHLKRFGVQRAFWQEVASLVLGDPKGTTGELKADGEEERGRLVVDLACGTGFVTRTLGSWLRSNDRLIASDLGEAPLKTTGRYWSSERHATDTAVDLTRVASDTQMLPLADASVDLVTMNAALHHIPKPSAALAEIDRVLKPGGFFALGFEPNHRHFSSPFMTCLSGGISRLHWYASPRQNRRRFCQLMKRSCPGSRTSDAATRASLSDFDDESVAVMNERLIQDGFIGEPLSESALLNLVDPHSRGDRDGIGFEPLAMLRESLPGYDVWLLRSSDYLGESARYWPRLRQTVDGVMRAVAPRQGSLFSWLISKPKTGSREAT